MPSTHLFLSPLEGLLCISIADMRGELANLLKIEGESSAELDGSSLPLLVMEGRILVLGSFGFLIVIGRHQSQVTQRI